MSGPDGIDERFGTLVGELRSGEATASPELRDRVRAIARREPEPPAARLRARLPRRRLTLVLAPLCALVAAAVGVGVFTAGENRPVAVYVGAGRSTSNLTHDRGIPAKVAGTGRFKSGLARSPKFTNSPTPSNTRAGSGSALQTFTPKTTNALGRNAYNITQGRIPDAIPPSGSRAQYYAVDLSLRVSDLSDSTRQAINLTRGWGGYVVSVDSGADRKAGTAYIVVRVPITKVQTALAKLSGLGTILANHVSIQDVQVQLNQRFSRMQALRVQITKLRQKLTNPSLTQSQKDFFQAAINQREGAITNLQKLQTAQETKASFATIRLDLETKKAAVAGPPGKQSQIGRALHNIGRVLVVEAEVLLYVLLIGAPFAVLAALVWMGRRGLRRRSEDQLLAR